METTTHFRNPDRGFRTWSRDEIVTESGNGQWVPNPGDLVFDQEAGFFLVVDVDYTTGLSTIQPWVIPQQVEPGDDAGDILTALGPGYSSESWRLFVDTSVTPHVLAPDARIYFRGTNLDGYKVFLGSDISESHGHVISSFQDSSGNFLGTMIPFETSEVHKPNGDVIRNAKVPMVGYTTEPLKDGERVTVVAYSDDGGPHSIAQLIVRNTEVIRMTDQSKRYVKGISIESPFLSDADPHVIEFPVNVTVESLPMTAMVHYSDGSRRYPIDGSRFTLMGLRNYVATTVGQVFPLGLRYQLGPDEVSYNLEPTANRSLVVPYQARTTPVDGSFEVKLFVFPVWVSPEVGYRLEFWLYNLDRHTYYNATQFVEWGSTSAPFRPMDYGTVQTLTVALDINKVDPRFAPYRHVQNFQIALLSRGDSHSDNWVVYFTNDQVDGFGRGLSAAVEYVNTNYWHMRIDNGYPSVETWLRAVYERIEPLVNIQTEGRAPTPTHFQLAFANNTYEYTVDQFNEELVVNNDLHDGELVYIHWIRRLGDGVDLQLGVSALPVRQLIDP